MITGYLSAWLCVSLIFAALWSSRAVGWRDEGIWFMLGVAVVLGVLSHRLLS